VYVHVPVHDAIASYPGKAPSGPALHTYLQNLYAGLLADPAIAGIAFGAHWDQTQPASGTAPSSFDWSYLDDVFAAASAAHKTVQLIITPGVDAPAWLMAQLPSCDPLFKTGSAPANCGSVTFAGFPEQQRADTNVMPLPWNTVYQQAWTAFLTSLNARYGSNPALVAVAISGPVTASDEFILPTTVNTTAPQPSGLAPDDMWAALIQHSFPTNAAYQKSDQVFIDAWKQAIDAAEGIFTDVTLFLGPDAGQDLPTYGLTSVTPHADNTLFALECSTAVKAQLVSCEAKTEILSYFVTVNGPNVKSTQVGGMTASSPSTNGNIGVPGVKTLTSLTPAPAVPFVGGAEFDFPISESSTMQQTGCPSGNSDCVGLTIEEAAYNVLTVFFNQTPAAAFYGGTAGTAPIQYLDVPLSDLQYAQATACPTTVSPTLGNTSLQDLYARASRDLFAMAGQTTVLPASTCAKAPPAPTISKVANAEGEVATIAPNTWVEVKGSVLAGTTRIWTGADFVNGQMPTKIDNVSVTVNGKPAFVYYVSPTQVNILTPPDSIVGSVSVVVTYNGTASAAFSVTAAGISPSLFVFGDGQHVAAVHTDGSLLGPTSLSAPGYTFTPAKPGETVQLYGNGFGPTNAQIISGSSQQSGTLSPLPTVTIGGLPATVSFAGLISPGLYQLNIVVPANAPGGDQPVTLTYGGASIQAGTVLAVAGGKGTPTSVTYYVATNGKDTWSGTLPVPNTAGSDGPFATFDRARAAVQALNKTGLAQVTVQFRGGMYSLATPIMFTAADSGTANLAITYQAYPGETPIFSGGVRVTGWTNTGGNTWTATLPAGTQYFENLFYNGARRLRPRVGGYLGTFLRYADSVYLNAPGPPANAPDPNCSVYISGSGWECFDRFQYDAKDPISSTWKNLAPASGNPCKQTSGNPALAGDIEILTWQQFSTSKLRVSCIDAVNHLIYFTGHAAISQTRPQFGEFVPGNRYLVENVQDALTQPGQFFLDRSTTPMVLTYLANPGENPNQDTVIAPQTALLLVTSNLQYVTFAGLTFEHDNYVIPAAGHKSSEMEPDIPAALSFQNAQHITFDSNTVTQISGTAVNFISCVGPASPNECIATNAAGTTANNVVQNSAFYDIGVLGVLFGNPYTNADTDANTPQFNLVQNNVVEGFGRLIPAAFGIAQGNGHDNVYTHNDVYDGYHTAVSISEAGGDTTKPNGVGNANNTISFNHVYNLFGGIMNDGGAIRIEAGNNVYTAPGNKILNNKIHDVSDASVIDSNGYGGHGIYLDNQTGLIDVENNLVYRVSDATIEAPQGPSLPNEANTIRNNILAYGQNAMVNLNGPFPYGVPAVIPQVYNITNNIFLFDRDNTSNPKFSVQGGCVYAGGAPYTQLVFFNNNLYWRTDGAFATYSKAFSTQPNPVSSGANAPCSGNAGDRTFYTFAQWQSQVKEDVQSVVQNPRFANPVYPADDFSLPNGSPGVGFVVFDPNQAGRTSAAIKPPAVPQTFPTKLFNPATDY
jgi:uncharacterized protein (TIGR03437 family)